MSNPYIPSIAEIRDIIDETPDTKTFVIEPGLSFKPGQFVELTVFGYGEAPFSISGGDEDRIELSIRAVGNVTRKLHAMKIGEHVGIRGPFGNGWPLEKAEGRNLLMVAGGIGLAPLKPVIEWVCRNRSRLNEVTLIYGARRPSLLLFKRMFDEWKKCMNVLLTVDEPEEGWKGEVGVVTKLCDKVKKLSDALTFMCGPPVMMKYASKTLIEFGFSPDDLYLSLERNMRCGIGICGHCAVSGMYVCKDGPIFPLNEALKFIEKPHEVQGVLD